MRVKLSEVSGSQNLGCSRCGDQRLGHKPNLPLVSASLAAPRSRPAFLCKSRIKEPTQNVARQVEEN